MQLSILPKPERKRLAAAVMVRNNARLRDSSPEAAEAHDAAWRRLVAALGGDPDLALLELEEVLRDVQVLS